jgi:hypothetical protein
MSMKKVDLSGTKPGPERIRKALDAVADQVLAHRAAARTKKAKKRQRARRKTQRESSI